MSNAFGPAELPAQSGDTIVCPGHDAKGRSVSTVEEEKRFNRRLAKAEEQFVCRMDSWLDVETGVDQDSILGPK